ncbi:MAG: hypothetical protein ACRDFX_01305 [Chloroflexota bacterium]
MLARFPVVRAWKQRPSPKLEYQKARELAEEQLRACDALVAEIEGTIALDLLPDHASERSRYRHALEKRADGAASLRKANNADAVATARDTLCRAVAGLIATRDALGGTSDKD